MLKQEREKNEREKQMKSKNNEQDCKYQRPLSSACFVSEGMYMYTTLTLFDVSSFQILLFYCPIICIVRFFYLLFVDLKENGEITRKMSASLWHITRVMTEKKNIIQTNCVDVMLLLQ